MLIRQFVRFFASTSPGLPVQAESNMIIDPHFFERKDLVSRVQNYFSNKSTLNDLERSCRDFKRSQINTKFLSQYNTFVDAFRREKFAELDELVSASLYKVAIE